MNFDYELGDRVPMETADVQDQEEKPDFENRKSLEEPIQQEQPRQTEPEIHQQPECKFNEVVLNEIKQQISGLQDLFVRRLYDDKQKTALISSLEEKATFAYVEPFVSDIILVLDRLDKAAPESLEFASSIAEELYEILNRRGVERIKVTHKFDPALNKVVRVENDDAADTPRVTRTIRNGYTFNGKVVRPAEVVVARKKNF